MNKYLPKYVTLRKINKFFLISISTIYITTFIISVLLISSCKPKETKEICKFSFTKPLNENGITYNEVKKIQYDVANFPLKDSTLFLGFKVGMHIQQVKILLKNMVKSRRLKLETKLDLKTHKLKSFYSTTIKVPLSWLNETHNFVFIFDPESDITYDENKLTNFRINIFYGEIPGIRRFSEQQKAENNSDLVEITNGSTYKRILYDEYLTQSYGLQKSFSMFFSKKYGKYIAGYVSSGLVNYWFFQQKEMTISFYGPNEECYRKYKNGANGDINLFASVDYIYLTKELINKRNNIKLSIRKYFVEDSVQQVEAKQKSLQNQENKRQVIIHKQALDSGI